jgi:DNA repair ATPase RecN
MQIRTQLTNAQVVAKLRKAADMLADVDALVQEVYEASDALYEMHNELEDMAASLEAEADELESIDA